MMHGSQCDMQIRCRTGAQPECDIFNRESSYFNVVRTTVLHLFCRMTNH